MLFELNVVGIFRRTYDPVRKTYDLLNCNDAYARILGYSTPNEIRGIHIGTVVVRKKYWKNYIKLLFRDKKIINYRAKIKQKNGKIGWILINSGARDFEESGKFLMEGTIIDITEQKRTEEKLQSTQKKLRALTSEILKADERQRHNCSNSP